MSYTLNDAMLAVVQFLAPKHNGLSTATGTTTTLIDATRKQANDQFNGGVLFIRSGTYAGQFFTITDYASATGTFTFNPAVAGNVPASVLYEAFALHSGLNLYDIISAINQALDSVGDVIQENTALTTTDGQESYDLPAGVYNVRKVEIARATSAPYRWMLSTHWHEINDDLRFEYQAAHFGTGYTMRISYLAPHDTLDSYDDAISQQINPQWLKYAAAINLMRSMANRGHNWKDMQTQFEEAQERITSLHPKRNIIVTVKGA